MYSGVEIKRPFTALEGALVALAGWRFKDEEDD
jgi:hypothetical protein